MNRVEIITIIQGKFHQRSVLRTKFGAQDAWYTSKIRSCDVGLLFDASYKLFFIRLCLNALYEECFTIESLINIYIYSESNRP
jgi:hypothetical protein